ncbi:MAG: lytic murein transglycosylase [Patescibacteria group bacterium]
MAKAKLVFAVLTLTFFTAVSFALPAPTNRAIAQEETTGDENGVQSQQSQREDLEKQLADLEKEIEENQKTIETYQKQGKTLKNEISGLNAKIAKLNLQIKTINLTLSKLNQEINETQRQVNRTENKIDSHKEALSRGIRNIYETDSQSLVEVLLANNNLSDFFGNLTNISLVQNNLRAALIEIVKLRGELLQQKEELSLEKEDAENLRAIQQSQKKTTETTQSQKATLLKVTKGKETEYQKILKKTQETAAQIRSRIFELLGGGELTFQKAYDYAQLAEGATGVRAAMILAVLHRESLLGKNTGRCYYKQAMKPSNIPIFLEILNKLGIDPESTVAKVSCANQDGAYGGAMGPAQFIPSTWKIFEEAIAKITGNNPPNPWTSSDAFVATGLYLKKYGADSKTTASEKKAAAIYYCGTSWQRYSCSYYAGKVLETASKFQKDIEILNANGN